METIPDKNKETKEINDSEGKLKFKAEANIAGKKRGKIIFFSTNKSLNKPE